MAFDALSLHINSVYKTLLLTDIHCGMSYRQNHIPSLVEKYRIVDTNTEVDCSDD